MSVKLPEEKNPYSQRTPFEILGVSRTATAEEIRNAQEERLEEINHKYANNDTVRLQRLEEVRKAYAAISQPRERVAVEIFFFDGTVGQEECRQHGEKHAKLSFDFSQVLKGTEDVFSTAPDVAGAEKHFRDAPFQQSVKLKTEGRQFQPDLKAEAMSSMTFDR